jgi:type II secretory ATPase GspE/PulE/Tfp pilus assembly ATPase PilB-like protein
MSDEPVEFEEAEFGAMPPHEAALTLIRKAADMRASDVHILSEENSTVLAVRRLGRVETLATVSRDQGRQMISLLKANAGMDIAERRRPMDGRWVYQEGETHLDLRINCLPTIHGEDMTCRLLDRRINLLTVEQLGMTRRETGLLRSMLNSPSGLILVTGPTGTGKTTTLYACLRYLNDGKRKLNTLEDPIEYSLPGVRQSQVHAKLGIHFIDLLRNVLRQAPDVIMIGEIRDDETAATAVRAANSGHMVLATLHAPVAAGAVQSMIALGAHRYFLASCLLGVVAQRLMRVLSETTRVGYDISEAPQTFAEIHSLLEPGQGKVLYGPDHTDEFSQEGYSSRTGLFEVMGMNAEIRRLIADGRPSSEIEKAAIANGMTEFRRGALLKVAQGVTSIEEMMRCVPTEHLGLED